MTQAAGALECLRPAAAAAGSAEAPAHSCGPRLACTQGSLSCECAQVHGRITLELVSKLQLRLQAVQKLLHAPARSCTLLRSSAGLHTWFVCVLKTSHATSPRTSALLISKLLGARAAAAGSAAVPAHSCGPRLACIHDPVSADATCDLTLHKRKGDPTFEKVVSRALLKLTATAAGSAEAPAAEDPMHLLQEIQHLAGSPVEVTMPGTELPISLSLRRTLRVRGLDSRQRAQTCPLAFAWCPADGRGAIVSG